MIHDTVVITSVVPVASYIIAPRVSLVEPADHVKISPDSMTSPITVALAEPLLKNVTDLVPDATVPEVVVVMIAGVLVI
jgi:hypothetical protein